MVEYKSQSTQQHIEDDLKNESGQIVVSSRMVAERFGKEHKTVLRSIEETIEGVAQNCANLFILTQYQHPQNKQWYPEYLMTRKGFTLLAMGFTEQDGEILVSGRELHEFLEIGTQYTKWFERMMEYGFVEGQEFVEVSQKSLTSHGREHSMTDHALKVDMAKEISMLQRNAKGKEASPRRVRRI